MSRPHVPALDGLRTVAVYLVLAFHAGIGQLSSGFVGVDLFFVLSGFLVTGLILAEIDEHGRLRLGDFYARRVRRLLPAAVIVILVTSVIFLALASAARRVPWTGDAQSALLYVANWRFLLESNDYFGADVDQSPFLHFWSLSIEEQFYLFFPLLVIGLARLRRWWRPALGAGLVLMFLISLCAQLYWARHDVNHAYYGTDARLYQLLAGSLAALGWRRAKLAATQRRRVMTEPSRLIQGTGWIFLTALILVASPLVDLTVSTRGIVATAAATGLILTLVENTGRSLSWLLGRHTMVYLGRISYGTYLWHWPVILAVPFVLDVGPWALAVVTFVLASALAALSFELLEHPIRTAARLRALPWSTTVAGLACSVLVALTAVPVLLQDDRRPIIAQPEKRAISPSLDDGPIPKNLDWASFAAETGPENTYCTLDDTTSCTAHEADEGPRVLLAGDSHARMLAPTLERLAEKRGFTLYYSVVGNCSWQRDVVKSVNVTERQLQQCAEARSALYGGLLDELGIDLAILSQIPRVDGVADATDQQLTGTRLAVRSVDESLDAFTSAGVRTIVITSQLVPGPSVGDPLECLATASRRSECRVPVPVEQPVVDALYSNAAARSGELHVVDINPLLCSHWPICDAVVGDQPIWRDEAHYLPSAIARHEDEIWELLAETGWFD